MMYFRICLPKGIPNLFTQNTWHYRTYVPELNGYIKFMKGKKYGFVGLDRTTGDITTFHIKNVTELSKKAPSLGFRK